MKRRLFNDAIYGLIEISDNLIFQLIEHPYFQRLRRIVQLGTAKYVFPCATHTRFSHALGALHLMQKTIQHLRDRGVEISRKEAQAVQIAILLHDIGHAPYSHSLEFNLLDVHHEEMSLLLMKKLNEEFDGRLQMAIDIFTNNYHKPFLHDLVSSQLDMDRLDYLTRDSFFTGVSEGIVGYDRLIRMFLVEQEQLVLDYKGLYSIENFLMARRAMYWQVYLHKTAMGASMLLTHFIQRAKELVQTGHKLPLSAAFIYFLKHNLTSEDLAQRSEEILQHYIAVDDTDIEMAIKILANHEDKILSILATCLLHRKLFKIYEQNEPIQSDQLEKMRLQVKSYYQLNDKESKYLVFALSQANKAYEKGAKELFIRTKQGDLKPISKWKEFSIPEQVVKYFLCYPRMS